MPADDPVRCGRIAREDQGGAVARALRSQLQVNDSLAMYGLGNRWRIVFVNRESQLILSLTLPLIGKIVAT